MKCPLWRIGATSLYGKTGRIHAAPVGWLGLVENGAPIRATRNRVPPKYALHLFMIDGHHRAVRRWRDGLRQMKVFIVAEQVGELWRNQRHDSDCTHRDIQRKTFEDDRDLRHDHVFVNKKAHLVPVN